LKGRIKQHGAPAYDSPEGRGGDKVLHFAPGTTVEVLDGYYGDFYAVKVHGRGEPGYIRRVYVDIQPDSDILTDGAPPKGETRHAGAVRGFFYGLVIGLLGAVFAFFGFMGLLYVALKGGSEAAGWFWVIVALAGAFLVPAGPIFFWVIRPLWGYWRRHEREDKDK